MSNSILPTPPEIKFARDVNVLKGIVFDMYGKVEFGNDNERDIAAKFANDFIDKGDSRMTPERYIMDLYTLSVNTEAIK